MVLRSMLIGVHAEKRKRGAHPPPPLEGEHAKQQQRKQQRGAHAPPPLEDEGEKKRNEREEEIDHPVRQRKKQQQEDQEEGEAEEERDDQWDAGEQNEETNEEESELAKLMGFSGFTTSHGSGKADACTKLSAARKQTTRQGRQYMNRKSGFNRPLPAEKTGEIVNRS